MKDFLVSAAPFIIIGLCVALCCVSYQINKNKSGKGTYIWEGLSVGMCLGLILSGLFSPQVKSGIVISLAMLVGETGGMLVRKH